MKIMDGNRFETLLQGFTNLKIAVIGDLIADEYLFCETSRVSREAPVLIVNYLNREFGLGGALNVANNLAALGVRVVPIGLLGMDQAGDDVLTELGQRAVTTDGIIRQPGFDTIAKTRILACSLHTTMQQILRIDRGEQQDLNEGHALRVEQAALETIDSVDAVIISDYGYGSISDNLLAVLRQKVVQKKLVVMADSRYSLERFHGLTAATPNVPEVQQLVGHRPEPLENLVKVGRHLRSELNLDCLLITRGKLGMAVFTSSEKEQIIPVYGGDQVADVTGAGDTVIATFAAARTMGADFFEAAVFSNVAGGLVVMKRGAATVSPEELIKATTALDLKRSI